MNKTDIQKIIKKVSTPAFIYDEGMILDKIRLFCRKINRSYCRLLFPLKSFTVYEALRSISKAVDGFAVSSLFEAKLARDIIGDRGTIHFTTPGLHPKDAKDIKRLCDHISFNSLSQWKQNRGKAGREKKYGLRVNPQLSFVKDDRYDPCGKYSKLGVPLDQVRAAFEKDPQLAKGISGLAFHTNCESEDFGHFLKTVKLLDSKIPAVLDRISWINVGGGYLFSGSSDWGPFLEAVAILRNKHKLEIFFEPGKGIVGEAGYIVSTVIDMFDSSGEKIAVLDTTVNHMPEVFEYQSMPEIARGAGAGKYRYMLAGASCLAGDVFGRHGFTEPLKTGSKVVFENTGAYSIVKASMFNGINLPDIYSYNGQLKLRKRSKYEDFLLKYRDKHAAI